jgi:hypothetical protein
MRHREGVVADVAVGEEVADVGNEGEMAGAPEAVGEGDGDADSDDGEGGVGEGDPTAGGVALGEGVFGVGEGCGDEDKDGEVGGEGVVLLVGGDGEEDEDEDGVKGEEKRGAVAARKRVEWAGEFCWRLRRM